MIRGKGLKGGSRGVGEGIYFKVADIVEGPTVAAGDERDASFSSVICQLVFLLPIIFD